MADITKIPSRRFQGHRERVRALAWNADGRRLASGSLDHSVRIWVPEKDTKTSTEMRGHSGEASIVRWDPTHPEHLASCSGSQTDRGVYFWDIRQGKPTAVVPTSGLNIHIAWSPDGKTIIVSNREDEVFWIDAETRTVIDKSKREKETNEAVFSHNGKLLMTAYAGAVEITTFPEKELIHTVQVTPIVTTSVDLDPRGRYLAAGSNDATVTLWETTEWTCVQSMGFHDEPIRVCRFSHDGQYLASTSGEPGVVISEIPSGKKLTTLPTGMLPCDSVAWHPSKPLLAYAGDTPEPGRGSSNMGGFRIWGL